jgi:F5/8 type C domain
VCKYGGLLNVLKPGGGNGHWQVYKWPNKRWTLIDPHGHPVFGIGFSDLYLNNYNGSVLDNKYGNHGVTWGPQQNRRMKSWGFNIVDSGNDCSVAPSNLSSCAGGTSWPDNGYQPQSFPYIFYLDSFGFALRNINNYCAAGTNAKDLFGGLNTTYFTGYAGSSNTDPYDPCYATWVNGLITETNFSGINVTTVLNSPWTMAVELGESDRYYGFQTAPSTEGFTTIPAGAASLNVGVAVVAADPWQSYYSHSSTPVLYTVNREYYAKQVGLYNFLTSRYATIAALNTAWGSTYDSFGTDGTNQTQSLGTGNGANLGPFAATLTFVPDHGSVWVKVGGVVVAGIDDCCPPTTTNNLAGPTVGSGTVNFSTKAITITFSAGNAPGNGAAITADYYTGGWGHGNGVMDEDGRNTWMPHNGGGYEWGTLAGLSAQMQTDMLDWFQTYADKMFKVPHDAVKANYPNMMYWGAIGLSGYCNPPPRPVLKAAAHYLDVIGGANTVCNQAQDQAVLDDLATYLGDIPIDNGFSIVANVDSGASANPAYCCFGLVATQNARGALYQTIVDKAFNQTVSIAGPQNGTIPTLQVGFWAWEDDPVEVNNFGFVSSNDNAYDGIESLSYGCTVNLPNSCVPCVDPWGYNCGAEAQVARTAYNVATGNGIQTTFTGTIGLLPIKPTTLGITSHVPTTVASDNFNRAGPSLGANWTVTGSLSILSNAIQGQSAGDNFAAWTANTFNNDQWSQVTVTTITNGGGPAVRISGGNFYNCFANGTVILIINQASTHLATLTQTVSNGDVLRMDAIGTALTCSLNGNIVLSVTDSGNTSGSAGLYINNSNGMVLDNWSGGNENASTTTDDGNGNINGTGAASTINYNTGAYSLVYSAAPTGGITGAFTTTGYGGLQPSYIQQVQAENLKIIHQLEAALYTPGSYSTNLAFDKPTVCSSEVVPPPYGSKPAPWITQACGRAIDGDTATTWQPSGSDPQFVRIDMVGQPSMGKVILRWGAGYWTNYTIDTSNDGLSWNTQFTKAGGAGGVETDTFTAVAARYIRVNGTARNGTPTLQEFEAYAQ